ncbi:hypothetical protein [Streptomyces anandii]|uniref:hypothetical protein n=1 Tax=Streptomyces anandii TaxID=285454 RepID=UPI0019AFE00B|nr:hypothetical protein [Streptomyces anandii]GGX98123.1 hypothetical protein GCM10010510_49610 [Streptomyces anandii JCM 4720]
MDADRRFAMAPFAAPGIACVVAGGLVAAATAPAPSTHGSWAAAYLVLVAGVAQVALGWGQAALAPRPPARGRVLAQAGTWNLGNAAVLIGTLTGVLTLVDLGGVVLVAGLALLADAVRGGVRHGAQSRRWQLYGFRLLVVVLLVSVPTGLVLARIGPN